MATRSGHPPDDLHPRVMGAGRTHRTRKNAIRLIARHRCLMDRITEAAAAPRPTYCKQEIAKTVVGSLQVRRPNIICHAPPKKYKQTLLKNGPVSVRKATRKSPFDTAQKDWIWEAHKKYDSLNKHVSPLHVIRQLAQDGLDASVFVRTGENKLSVLTEQIRWYLRTRIEDGAK